MEAPFVVYHPTTGSWFALEVRVPGPAAGRHPSTGWVHDLDQAARLSVESAALVAAVHGAVSLTLAEAWRRTEPRC